MKYIFLAALLCLLAWLGWRFIRRKLRGETAAEQPGPRNITLVAIAIVVVYGVLLAIRWIGY